MEESHWTNAEREAFDHCIDMLTGIFLNEKAARIRIHGYYVALRDLEAAQVLPVVDHFLLYASAMPSPYMIRLAVESLHPARSLDREESPKAP